MVEPISMAVGTAIGVAGLYSVCMHIMEQALDGKALGKDSEKLFSLLQVEQLLFKRWGERAGIHDSSKQHRCLDDTTDEYLVIRSILQNIEIIWSDGDTLSGKYGIEPADVSGDGGVRRAADRRQKQTSIKGKFFWAIKDKKKFEHLVSDVGAFVQKLFMILDLDLEVGDTTEMPDIDDKLSELRAFVTGDSKKHAEEMVKQQRFRCEVTKYLTDQKRKELLGWVDAVSTEYEYDAALRARHPGTCQWIFKNGKFLDWLGPPYGLGGSRLLWIHGGPGTGKTFLSASVVQYLKIHSSHPTAYFFCTHEDVMKNQPLSITRSWVVQLARQSVDALKVIDTMKTGEPVETRVWDIFRAVLGKVGSCNLVLDGFDECLDHDPISQLRQVGVRRLFLEELLRSIQPTKSRVLIISRDIPGIRNGIFGDDTVSHDTVRTPTEYAINKNDTEQDIQSISSRIVESMKIANKTSRDDVLDKLSTRCDGMFLWLRLAGERLKPRMRASQLETALSSMPSGLNQAYKRDLERISRLDEADKEYAKRILRWMLFALRPLSVRELIHALAVDANGDCIQHEDIPDRIDDDCLQSQILDLCGSLLEARADSKPAASIEDRRVHFVHFSAKEFLLNAKNECQNPETAAFFFQAPTKSHVILAKTCLSYIVLRVEIPEPIQNGFSDYSFTHWVEHFKACPVDRQPECMDLERRLFKPGPAFEKWSKQEGSNLDPLGMAAFYGLADIFEELLLDPQADPGKVYPHKRTMLHLAASRGHANIVEQLLARPDVDINAKDNSGQTPLYQASSRGHLEVLKLLLARDDVDVNAVDSSGWTPLYHASVGRKTDVIKLLITRDDLDVNLGNNSAWTALFSASFNGLLDIVRLLLTRDDLDVNFQKQDGWTALTGASCKGHAEVVKLLLRRDGVEVNTFSRSGLTPLMHASISGHAVVVQLLLRVDSLQLDIQDKDGRTALQLATEKGYQEVVQLLQQRLGMPTDS